MSKKNKDKKTKPHKKHAQDAADVTSGSDAVSDKLNAYETKIQELEAELAAMTDKYQRVCAEYDNLQKRVPKQIQDGINYQKESILKSLLASMDNFEHTLTAADESHDADSIIQGVKLVYKGFLDALKAHGVEQIHSLGEEFDPAKHQAMMQQCDTDKPDNTVLMEYQKGYMLGEKVLRAAMVVVNKIESEGKPEDENKNDSDGENKSGTEVSEDESSEE